MCFFCVAFSCLKMWSHHVFCKLKSDSSVFKNHVGLTTHNSALYYVVHSMYMEDRILAPTLHSALRCFALRLKEVSNSWKISVPISKAKTVYCEVSTYCALARTSDGGVAAAAHAAHAAGDREHPVKSCRFGHEWFCAPQAWKKTFHHNLESIAL